MRYENYPTAIAKYRNFLAQQGSGGSAESALSAIRTRIPITSIYDLVEKLAGKANTVSIGWDSPSKNKLLQAAKREAKATT